MKQTDFNQEFQALRQGFNDLDQQLIDLLSKRFELSLKMGKVKEQLGLATEDLSRELEIAESIRGAVDSEVTAQAVIAVYQEIIKQSKLLQSV